MGKEIVLGKKIYSYPSFRVRSVPTAFKITILFTEGGSGGSLFLSELFLTKMVHMESKPAGAKHICINSVFSLAASFSAYHKVLKMQVPCQYRLVNVGVITTPEPSLTLMGFLPRTHCACVQTGSHCPQNLSLPGYGQYCPPFQATPGLQVSTGMDVLTQLPIRPHGLI